MMLRIAILGVLILLIGCAFGQAICTARTPEQAVPAQWRVQDDGQPISAKLPARSSRYRLARVVVDRELHRRWALIANCTHPQFPLQTVPLAAGPAEAPPIHAPDSLFKSTALAVPAAPIQAERVPRQVSVVRSPIFSGSFPSVPTAPKLPIPAAPASSATAPLVRAGDLVHLWSSDANVHLEMEVVSLEYGRAGQVIHLRRLGQTALLAGVVVGKDSAELIP